MSYFAQLKYSLKTVSSNNLYNFIKGQGLTASLDLQ